MSREKSPDRPPRDLSVPETMKIAALLAELMPPAAGAAQGSQVVLTPTPGESVDDSGNPALAAPILQVEDLDDFEPIAPPPVPAGGPSPTAERSGLRPSSSPRIMAKVIPAKPLVVERVPEPPKPALPPLVAPPSAQFNDEPASALSSRSALLSDPEFRLPDRPQSPEPKTEPKTEVPSGPIAEPAKALDPDLIPLGNLSAAGFFSLVNWRNDPDRARHPRRADYGLDEQTLSLARRNPFYVIGQPRRTERRSVAEVLSEIVWE